MRNTAVRIFETAELDAQIEQLWCKRMTASNTWCLRYISLKICDKDLVWGETASVASLKRLRGRDFYMRGQKPKISTYHFAIQFY